MKLQKRALKQFLKVQVIRGTAAAPLSQLLTALGQGLRAAAGLGAWQIISPASGSAAGRLELAARLKDVQHSRYPQATILLVERVGGDEEIPEVGGCPHCCPVCPPSALYSHLLPR